jgi:sigma-B regulation protein RsbU (phosphoserine phosphatase)
LSQSLRAVDEILRRVNQLLVHDLETGRFVSLFLAILDPTSRSLVYATAGQPAYHVQASGEITRLNNSGMVLGLLDDAEIPRGERIELQTGDLIFVATDGLHETHAADGSMFGTDRMLDFVRTNRQKGSRAILEGLYESAGQFRQGASQQDDVTMVLIKA